MLTSTTRGKELERNSLISPTTAEAELEICQVSLAQAWIEDNCKILEKAEHQWPSSKHKPS